MRKLLDALRFSAENTPDKPFLVLWEGGKYRIVTYADFLDLVRSITYHLDTNIEKTEGLAFIVVPHHPLLHGLFIASMNKGLIPSYLPFPTPKQDHERYFASHKALLERTKPAVIITYDAIIDRLRDIAPASTKLIRVEDYSHQGYAEFHQPSDESIALVQHSSGTTGLKKGVELTFGQIALQAEGYAKTAGLEADSAVASWLPLYHDMGLLSSFLIPLSLGASIVSLDAFEWVKNPGLLLQLMDQFHCTHTWLPNFAFNHIVNAVPESATYDLSCVRAMISCSEPVKMDTMEAFAGRFGACGVTLDKLQGCYAMAESVFAVAQYPVGQPSRFVDVDAEALTQGNVVKSKSDQKRRRLVSNGKPLDNIDVCIVRDGKFQRSANTGVVGEIAIRGGFVFDEYYKNPEATEKAFADGWYLTGDQGFMDKGELFICGRIKDVIIVHGRNYYAHDIEEILSEVEGVIPGRAVAIGVDDEATASEEVVILAETRLEDPIALRDLKRAVKRAVFDRLELTVKQVELVEPTFLVKTTSGKLSRVENLARFKARKTERMETA